ncbi:MAG: hypothetical protein J6R83_01115 [Clostridia bacterium]|nr:hypothetical protein [Clostridia bacterium]
MAKSIKNKLIILILLTVTVIFQIQPFWLHKNAYAQTVETDKVWLLDGASIKMSTKDLRLRYYARVDYEYYTQNPDAEVGIIITATDYIPRVSDFTFKHLDLAELRVVAIKAVSFPNQETAEQDGYLEFHCDLTNIAPQNLDRDFTVRPFIRFNTGVPGEYSYEYGAYDLVKNTRSVYGLVEYWLDNLEIFSTSQIEALELLYYSVNELNPDLVEYTDQTVTFTFKDVKRGVIKLNGTLNQYGKVTVKVDQTEIQPLSGAYYDVSKFSSGKTFSVTFEKNADNKLPEKLVVTHYREYRAL